jgi:type III secretion protein Q
MKTLTTLRCIDANSSGNSAERLIHLGYLVRTDEFVPARHYLRFEAEFEDRSRMAGLIDVASWITRAVPDTYGIDWSSLDTSLIQPLIDAYPLQLEIDNQHAPILSSILKDLVTDSSAHIDCPRLTTPTGMILVRSFDYGRTEDGTLNLPGGPETNLVSRLEYVLGYSQLPLAALAAIEVGDVLLLTHNQARVISAGTTLFNFRLDQQSLVIEDLTENDDRHDVGREFATMNAEEKLNDLPVTLSFVLMEKTVTLTELKAMAPGEKVDLPDGQAMRIEIRANQRKFCHGELVQLPDGQLAVEIRQIA